MDYVPNRLVYLRITNPQRQAKPLAKVVWRLLLPYKGNALKTITTDNGSEFAEYEWITRHLQVPVYCSWQKGTVENGNKLVRQSIKKGRTSLR